MKRKTIFALLLGLLMSIQAIAGLNYKAFLIDIVDSQGRIITAGEFTVTVYNAGSTAATVYSDDNGTALTNPIVYTVETAHLPTGTILFWGPAATYDIGITSGAYSGAVKVASIRPIDHQITFPLSEVSGNVSAGTIAATGTLTVGVDGTGADVTFYGDTAGDYLLFDQNGATNGSLILEDCPLSLGDATKILFGDPLNTGDLYLQSTSTVLTLGQVVAGAGDFRLGVNDAGIDFTLFGDTALQKAWWDASGDEWFFGADAEGVDVTFYGDTASSYMKWDENAGTNGELLFDAANIALGDGDKILFGDTLGTGDFVLSDLSDVLTFDVVAAGVGEMAIGNDADDVPLKWYGETTGAFAYLTDDYMQFDKMKISFSEGDGLLFGDPLNTGDISLTGTSNLLTFGQVVAGTGAVAFGVNDAGVDVTLYGDTASYSAVWDASDNQLEMTDAAIAYVGNAATYTVNTSTSGLLMTATDNAASIYTIGASGGTNGLDLIWQSHTAGGTVTFDAGADTFTAAVDALFNNNTTLGNAIGDITTFTGKIAGATPLSFDGATANTAYTILAVADVGSSITVTMPNSTSTLIGSTLATNNFDVANSIWGASNGLVFEGATGGADAYETTITPTDPTADRTITLPNRTGTVTLASAASVITPSATPTLTVGLSNLYTLSPTDNEDETITFSGAGTAGDTITIVCVSIGSADEILTFHATLVSSAGTLTVPATVSHAISITFISNGSHWYEVCRTGDQT